MTPPRAHTTIPQTRATRHQRGVSSPHCRRGTNQSRGQRTAGAASDTRLITDVRALLTGRARLRLTYLSPPLTIQSP